MNGLIYFNGMLKHEHEVTLWTLDRSYLYGEGLFETLKASQGFIPFLPEHLQRLFHGMEVLRMRFEISASKIEFALYQTLHHNRLKDAYLRLMVSRENREIGSMEIGEGSNVVVLARPFEKPPLRLYTEGMSAQLVEDFKIFPDPLCQVKSTNYLRPLLAHRMARESGYDEALLLNTFGNLAEGATGNLFIFDGKKILTPPLSEGPLPGVTRQVVLELMKKNYLDYEEGPIKMADLLAAEEAFFTNSIKEIAPLTSVNDKPIGTGKVGAQTQRLMELFQEELQYRLESFESKRWGVK
ncbi:MAG TPA: hypothetical protein DF383_10020 [Deltaproteobacteria bacterium]|nr:hypothetical protein [Deltaproteobacteria bacterium]